MFGLFKKKSELEQLDDNYKKLMEEAFILSKSNRTESDKKYGEAHILSEKIALLKANEKK